MLKAKEIKCLKATHCDCGRNVEKYSIRKMKQTLKYIPSHLFASLSFNIIYSTSEFPLLRNYFVTFISSWHFYLNKMQYDSMTLPFRLPAIDYYVSAMGFRNGIHTTIVCLFVCLFVGTIVVFVVVIFFSHSAEYPYIGIWKSDVFASVSFIKLNKYCYNTDGF